MGAVLAKMWYKPQSGYNEVTALVFDPEAGLGATYEPGSDNDLYGYDDMFDHALVLDEPEVPGEGNSFTRNKHTSSTSTDEFGVDEPDNDLSTEPVTEPAEQPPLAPLVPPNMGWLALTGRRPYFSASRGSERVSLPHSCPYIEVQPPTTFGFLYTRNLPGGQTSQGFRAGFVFCDNRAGAALRDLAGKKRREHGSYLAVSLPNVRVSVNRTGAGTVYIDRLDMSDPQGIIKTQYVNLWPRSQVTGDAYCVRWIDYVTAFSTDDSVVVVGNSTHHDEAGAVLLFITFVADSKTPVHDFGPTPYPWTAKLHNFVFAPILEAPGIDPEYCTRARVVYSVPVQAWMRQGAGPVLIRSEGWVLLFIEHTSRDTVARPRYFSAWLVSSRNRNLSMGIVDLAADSTSLLNNIHHLLSTGGPLLVEATAFVSASRQSIPLPYCRILIKFVDKVNEGAVVSEDTVGFEMRYAPVDTVDSVADLSRMQKNLPVGAAYPRLGDAGMCAVGAWDVQVEMRPGDDDISCVRVYLKNSQGFSRCGFALSIGRSGVVRVDLHKSTDRPGTLAFVIFSEHTVCSQEDDSTPALVMSFIVVVIDIPTGAKWAYSPLGTRPKANILAALVASKISFATGMEHPSSDLYNQVETESRTTPHVPRRPSLGSPTILYTRPLPPPPRQLVVRNADSSCDESSTVPLEEDSRDAVYEYTTGSETHEDEEQETSSDPEADEGGCSASASRSLVPPALVPVGVLIFEEQLAVVLANHIVESRLCTPWYGTDAIQLDTRAKSASDVFSNSCASERPRFLAAGYYTCPPHGEPFSATFGVIVLDGETKVLGVVALGADYSESSS